MNPLMNDWFQKNAWSLIIAAATLISTFTLYGYRIDALEKQVDENKAAIQVLNTGQVNLQVQLAGIATDISYIKQSIDRIIR